MVHPTAIIHPGARLGEQVRIGPFAVIGEHVSLGDRTIVGPHAVIEGRTQIGCDNHIFQFASVGAIPQDLKFRGEETYLRIGDGNIIREFVTIHLGTESGGGYTLIGDGNLFMAYCHVAHDCQVGNRVIMANGSTLAGHVEVQDHAILGGLSAIHQFARVGAHVMVSGGAMVNQDIPPYTIAQGDRARTVGLNLVGLKRRGFTEETISAIKLAYRLVFRSGLRLEEALARVVTEVGEIPEVVSFVEFIRKSQRGIAR
ncbi:acyl-ACP--UDP-N-acetylglucosamine O-acyltransferase [Geoalkalibacter halelectricus]|uniref:Acyl-[acyl-carrier-protein]--UDP-N-acetylglucosamine O-acyltransferase n=1 Tax=Geoalkalibacter halelectricus TaxID=2847045 RepID=A0ABY5ZG66_9BACT|nr:acyl-ACP--UDP-N-acetylglucosamine O-acyltransferase [Geoalkalibacter halelectricus]MDO3379564.1 acyl-ACP--UDP-N-acetylglucosamine O-acyltransferase [Geoalkalibacter halelectricus]UWZ78152.1 acyl-ACP--UDP-N-acetylglucosamine O-acyltransferase [Geoalkalibacter halelectricus]